jgi:1-deoxy-D-xylulose-5-phosphate synthase
VGIAEQHALTFAAGLACEGFKPVVAIYSTFLQRAYDQLIHDVALQKLPMVLALDRAGIVGADGATHAGIFDIPFLRCVPNVSIATPADEAETRALLTSAFEQDHCVAVRYPRGSGVGQVPERELTALPFGKGELKRAGQKIAIVAFGPLLYPALKVAEKLDLTVLNMRWAKPLDLDLLLSAAKEHEALVTLEDSALMGGCGSAVLEALQTAGLLKPVLMLGLKDQFTEHGDPAKLMALEGLDAAGIEASILARFNAWVSKPISASKPADAPSGLKLVS